MPKIAALAALVDEIVVLADGAIEGVLLRQLPRPDVSTRATKLGRGARFEAALARELPGLRGGAVVAHMCPIYAVLAAPVVRPLRVPLLLWFTHWRASRLLRAAERLSTAVVSVDRRSFPLESDKVKAIGRHRPLRVLVRAAAGGDSLRLLALGRYSRAKGLEVVLRAIAAVGGDVVLDVYGPALSDDERAHRQELEWLVAELDLEGRATLGDAVPRARFLPSSPATTRS